MGKTYYFRYNKIKSKITENGLTQEDLAKKVGINVSTLSQKFNNQSEFKQSEMIAILRVLGVPMSEIESYFFVL